MSKTKKSERARIRSGKLMRTSKTTKIKSQMNKKFNLINVGHYQFTILIRLFRVSFGQIIIINM